MIDWQTYLRRKFHRKFEPFQLFFLEIFYTVVSFQKRATPKKTKKSGVGNKNPKDIDFAALLVHFNALQAQHEAMRLNESEKDVIGSSSADRFLDNLEGSDEPLRLSIELDDTVNNVIDEATWY